MSKKIYFMRDKDIEVVNQNIDEIKEKAHLKEIHTIEPMLDEFNEVKNIILNFIRKEKRIVYGGYAWNSLIAKVSPNDAFYKDTEYTDVEFYSNKPVEDLVKLCNIISEKGYKFIQGKNAQHEETYTIFVNFTGYCDITYMPSNIFYGVMTETINGIRMIHPKFIMVDILRQFNDPMTSYWRLDKNVKRGKIMMRHYPLELSSVPIEINQLSIETLKIIDYILPHLVKSKTLMFIGQIAYNAYTNPNINISKQISNYDNKPLEIISINLKKDVEILYNLIYKYYIDQEKGNIFDDKILLEQYHPFFQFTDKKAIFKYNGETFMIIYGNNEKCIPFNEIKLSYNNKTYPIKIGTFNITFMYTLIKFHQAYADKEHQIQKLQDYLMFRLLKARNEFFTTNNKTILDNTIYEDFKIECFGEPISPARKFMLSRRNRSLMPSSAIRPYDPEERKDNFPFDSYFFNNTSGNIINNKKDLIFNTKKD